MSIRILPVFSPSFPARLSHFTSCSVGCSYRPHPPPGKLNSKAGKLRSFCAVKDSDSEAAAAATTATEDWSARWVLEPVGNGDFRHIGYRIPRPGAIELASDVVVTIGRTPEKADAVVAVPTGDGRY
ncbi:hypothetical protein M569_17458 [Genlisea aurea]|uniref:Uncharacterized protein n=1 Tax=Genlisea aurea TaxID=192259 RepID=S8BS33_9LAMI|nr:hypothetical protein M569_17458 [Genlisea aurea]